jgi:hypothetical protein
MRLIDLPICPICAGSTIPLSRKTVNHIWFCDELFEYGRINEKAGERKASKFGGWEDFPFYLLSPIFFT